MDEEKFTFEFTRRDVDFIHNALTFYGQNKKEQAEDLPLLKGEETIFDQSIRLIKFMFMVLARKIIREA